MFVNGCAAVNTCVCVCAVLTLLQGYIQQLWGSSGSTDLDK